MPGLKNEDFQYPGKLPSPKKRSTLLKNNLISFEPTFEKISAISLDLFHWYTVSGFLVTVGSVSDSSTAGIPVGRIELDTISDTKVRPNCGDDSF